MLTITTQKSKSKSHEWATVTVGDVEFKVAAKIRKNQAVLVVDAPREIVSVILDSLKREDYELDS